MYLGNETKRNEKTKRYGTKRNETISAAPFRHNGGDGDRTAKNNSKNRRSLCT